MKYQVESIEQPKPFWKRPVVVWPALIATVVAVVIVVIMLLARNV